MRTALTCTFSGTQIKIILLQDQPLHMFLILDGFISDQGAQGSVSILFLDSCGILMFLNQSSHFLGAETLSPKHFNSQLLNYKCQKM